MFSCCVLYERRKRVSPHKRVGRLRLLRLAHEVLESKPQLFPWSNYMTLCSGERYSLYRIAAFLFMMKNYNLTHHTVPQGSVGTLLQCPPGSIIKPSAAPPCLHVDISGRFRESFILVGLVRDLESILGTPGMRWDTSPWMGHYRVSHHSHTQV